MGSCIRAAALMPVCMRVLQLLSASGFRHTHPYRRSQTHAFIQAQSGTCIHTGAVRHPKSAVSRQWWAEEGHRRLRPLCPRQGAPWGPHHTQLGGREARTPSEGGISAPQACPHTGLWGSDPSMRQAVAPAVRSAWSPIFFSARGSAQPYLPPSQRSDGLRGVKTGWRGRRGSTCWEVAAETPAPRRGTQTLEGGCAARGDGVGAAWVRA